MTGLRVLLTGSRSWTDRRLIRRVLIETLDRYWVAGPSTLVHGACHLGGADIIGAQVWTDLHACGPGPGVAVLGETPPGWWVAGLTCEPHPARWGGVHGKEAGFIRNAEMVRLGADVCVAFPLGESLGTRHTMALAARAGIPLIVTEGAPADDLFTTTTERE